MNVAILEAGRPPRALRPAFGTYVSMTERLLGPGFEHASYDVAAGMLPARPEDHDAYLVTGAGFSEDRDPCFLQRHQAASRFAVVGGGQHRPAGAGKVDAGRPVAKRQAEGGAQALELELLVGAADDDRALRQPRLWLPRA